MRRPDGKMSKKDRRALLAFGVVPHEPVVWTNPEPITLSFDPSPRNVNSGALLWNNLTGTLMVQGVNGWTSVTSQPMQVTWTFQ